MSGTPIHDQLAAELSAHRHARDEWGPAGGGAHQWRTEPDTEEMPVGRHDDHDGDGIADHADPDWLPAPPEPATPLGPRDPEDPVYVRTGDHEPPRWPDPAPDALAALEHEAADLDMDWLTLAAEPIVPSGGAA